LSAGTTNYLWIGGCVGPFPGLDDVEKRIFSNCHPTVIQPAAIRYTDYAAKRIFQVC
jgi:hypothetical protein